MASAFAALAAVPIQIADLQTVVDRLVTQVTILAGSLPDELLDASAYGQMVGQTAAAARRAEERGTGYVPAIRVGKRLRWRRRDVASYLATAAKTDRA